MSDLTKRLRDEPNWQKIKRFGLNEVECKVWHKTCCDGADEIERLEDAVSEKDQEIERLREIEAAALEAYYFNGFHAGGCMCANCLLKLILEENSTMLERDRKTVKAMK